jgi:hypothetical protein
MNYISSLLTSIFELSKLQQHPLDEKSKKAANKDLMGKSIERWESILCYLALPSETADKSVSETTRALFHFMGLIKGSWFGAVEFEMQFFILFRHQRAGDLLCWLPIPFAQSR